MGKGWAIVAQVVDYIGGPDGTRKRQSALTDARRRRNYLFSFRPGAGGCQRNAVSVVNIWVNFTEA